MIWVDIRDADEDSTDVMLGVLELDKLRSLGGLGLELYLRAVGTRTVGFWLLQDGTLLRSVRAGDA